jgi:proline racemase
VEISTPSLGKIKIDIVFSSVFFVLFNIDQTKYLINSDQLEELVQTGKELIQETNRSVNITMPKTTDKQKVMLSILYNNISRNEGVNVVISPSGSLDRSPCGAGTGARMALLHSTGQLKEGEIYNNISLIGTRFRGYLSGTQKTDELMSVIPNIIGESYLTGFHYFVRDSKDKIEPFLT